MGWFVGGPRLVAISTGIAPGYYRDSPINIETGICLPHV
ncbi:hypothetical protein YpsIP31758_2297 [Yersinia pseudotuberculosis IP 31758]|uniref:Uncharacterized protein n=1 Tax=Yersinia pseudotuberculosis serotype O:1b (strain IP 31758) TaxID=349747 RepID=A0A0U1QWN5_YERP3|nr:hypothetical protein YpsIP31758_2297 [Yersinia pseudotuberculosis IP 31758]